MTINFIAPDIKELKRRNLKKGLATLCVGGGQGGALWLETC